MSEVIVISIDNQQQIESSGGYSSELEVFMKSSKGPVRSKPLSSKSDNLAARQTDVFIHKINTLY